MTTFAYCRVSTVGQSLETQLGQLSFCDKLFQEKLSGGDRNRPQLNYILDHIRSGDTLVVTKLDRLVRSTKDLLDIVELLEKRKAALKILNINLDTATPTGKLMLTLLGAIAEFEKNLMLERQRDGIIRAQAAGRYKGRVPSARNQTPAVRQLLSTGAKPAEVAALMGMGVASVYRIKKGAA